MTSISRACGKEDHISFQSWNFTNRDLKEGVVTSAGVGRKYLSLIGNIFLIFIFIFMRDWNDGMEEGWHVCSQ